MALGLAWFESHGLIFDAGFDLVLLVYVWLDFDSVALVVFVGMPRPKRVPFGQN